MTRPLFNLPCAQPLDDSGRVMPGCYLSYFESETDTPADVYAAGAGGSPLGPVVTSSDAGRFVPIYMDPTVLYRVQLHDADDVLIYDVDPVYPIAPLWDGQVLMHDGPLEDVPAGWQVMDGTGGTIDTRDRHPRGVGSSTALGETGGSSGSASGTTDPGGAQLAGVTGGHALTAAENGPHEHEVWVDTTSNTNSVCVGFGFAANVAVAGITPDSPGDVGAITDNGAGEAIIRASGSGTAHTHTTPSVPAHDHDFSIAVTAPFFGIYFLKFVG